MNSPPRNQEAGFTQPRTQKHALSGNRYFHSSLTAVERPRSPFQDLEGEGRHDVGLPRDHARPLDGLGPDGGDELSPLDNNQKVLRTRFSDIPSAF